MFLSQSGQLYIEAAIHAHGRVYDFGPAFRAEKSKTRRHLNELWMMDAETAFTDNEANMKIQEELVYYIIQEILKINITDLELLERDISKLEKITIPFARKKHADVVKELQAMGSDIKTGEDL
jgi:asparaginyl-tRNA synthetase